jgi:hypothetical protein
VIHWLRVVWPPWWALGLAATVFLGLQMPYLLLERAGGMPSYSLPDRETNNISLGFLIAGGALYGVHRVLAFHPAMRPGYYAWLMNTPWTCKKPLPLGPVHLVLQDVLLLGLAFAVAWPRLQWHALFVLHGFLSSYLATVGAIHAATGAPRWAYAVGFGLGLMVLSTLDPAAFAAAASATYAIAVLGLRAALACFPWERSPVHDLHQQLVGKNRVKPAGLGWPYDYIGPSTKKWPAITLIDALLIGTLAGWFFFVISFMLRSSFDAVAGQYFALFGMLLIGVIARIALYCVGYSPPISWLGRLARGMPIVTGYDQVFVAPLLGILVGIAAWFLPSAIGVDSLWVTPIACCVACWILLGMGPSVRIWRLTGNHRISPGVPTAVYTR